METLTLNDTFERSLENSISFDDYFALHLEYANNRKTTGPNQNEDLIYYTKLNAQRSKRIDKTIKIADELTSLISSIKENQTWLLITETWCGDAANSVPVIANIAAINPKIDLRIVLRDENLELMNQFLTNGGRSIPKLIVIGGDREVLASWGPRPRQAQELYDVWRNDENRVPYKEFQVDLQKWYNQDKGMTLQQEFVELLSR